MQARLELYKTKVTKMESEKWLQEHRPSLSINVAGANRFINAAIPELSQEQKQALRRVRLSLNVPSCIQSLLICHAYQRQPAASY